MRYFFISDIHGNLPALEKFVSKINEPSMDSGDEHWNESNDS